MMQAGTPCPYDGMIGVNAKEAWDLNEERQPSYQKGKMDEDKKSTLFGAGVVGSLLLLLLAI
jgi:hypothetical protein